MKSNTSGFVIFIMPNVQTFLIPTTVTFFIRKQLIFFLSNMSKQSNLIPSIKIF